MDNIGKQTNANLNIKDILDEYIRSGSVKSIQKLSQPNLYKITVKGTETPSKFSEIRRHLQRHGFQTKASSYNRTSRARYYARPINNARIPFGQCDRYIIAKVAAPPEPKNPDDFGRPQPRRASQNKKRG